MEHLVRLQTWRWQWTIIGIAVFISCVSAPYAAEVKGRVIDEQGNGISQAVIFVQTPPSGGTKPAAPHTATLDQIDKQFVPSLLPISVGTEVQFPNYDQIHHHVYSFSRAKSFDLPLYKGEAKPSVAFDQPGVIDVGCNIHDWMSAIILVVPSPYYATTDTNGRFALPDIPPGTYPLVSWHERSRSKTADTTQQVRVDETTPELTFTLSLKPAQGRAATSGQRGAR